jgi:hypothetical protein
MKQAVKNGAQIIVTGTLYARLKFMDLMARAFYVERTRNSSCDKALIPFYACVRSERPMLHVGVCS